MPFYDLKCDKCGEAFNIKASIQDREQKLIKCPNCGSDELSAVFTNVNVVKSLSKSSTECPNIHKCGGCCHH